jgi:hypothetical protein
MRNAARAHTRDKKVQGTYLPQRNRGCRFVLRLKATDLKERKQDRFKRSATRANTRGEKVQCTHFPERNRGCQFVLRLQSSDLRDRTQGRFLQSATGATHVRNHNGARNFKRAEEELQKSKLDRKARTREHRVQREQYSRFNNNAKERPSKLISQRNTFTTR